MYNYELHLHTSESSTCGHIPAEEQVRRAKELGLTGIVVTDHFHGGYFEAYDIHDNWPAFVDRYMRGYRAAKEAGEKEGLEVIFGVELRFPEDERDYLTYGITEEWLLKHPYCMMMSHQEFYNRYHRELLMIQAHPFRHYDSCDADHVDGIEIVNCNPRHDSRNHLALEIAKANPRLLRTVGSDVHQVGDEGRSYVSFEKRITNQAELREELTAGRFTLWCPEFDHILRASDEDRKKNA